MAVLLTGGAGFIGSHTCVEFLEAGEDIVVMDNFSNSKKEVIDNIREITGRSFPFYETDMLDEDGVRAIFRENEIESVVHFAGVKAVGESVEKPLSYYGTNVSGALNMLRVMDEFECRRMVFSSSACVYGEDNDIPYREGMPTLSATNPYGQTKIIIERIMQDLFASNGQWSIVLLRYFNPIGAHSSALIGEDPEGIPNNLLPYISKLAVGKLPELCIYGNDYPTRDGTGVRDYIHVVDLARGHLAAIEYARGRQCCEPVNLGTGTGYSVFDVLHAYERACGKTLPYKIAPRRAGDIAEFYADPSKARELFGWEAKKDLDEMCADSWRFARKAHGII